MRMTPRKAYIYPSPALLEPFDTPAKSAWIGGRTLGTWQREVLESCGLERVEVSRVTTEERIQTELPPANAPVGAYK